MRKSWTKSEVSRIGREVVFCTLCLVGALFVIESCTQPPKDAAHTAVVVADDVCKIIEATTDTSNAPDWVDWVTVACAVDGALVNVRLPKAAWYAAKMKDAGPGK